MFEYYAVGLAGLGNLSAITCIKLSVVGRMSFNLPFSTTTNLASAVGTRTPPNTYR